MKKLYYLLLAILPCQLATAIDITGSITSGGISRSFVLHAPGTAVAPNLPVMIVMHGDGGTGAAIQSYTGFDAVANANNFMVVYPNAVGGSWRRALGEPEDVQFISNLIDYLCTTYYINQQKVYASGHSAGGYMTYNLAVHLANKVAAFAPVAGNMYSINGYNYNAYFGTAAFKKVPIYHIHGDADNVVSYPDPDFTPAAWQEWPFFQFTYSSFGSCNVTTYTNTSTLVAGVQQVSFCNGNSGTDKPVYLIRIMGGGHGWPAVAGFNTPQRIWDFCNAFSLTTAPACTPPSSTINYIINTTTGRTAISPLIYGINDRVINNGDRNTAFRLGGTRLNSYNWENNASHAGIDYLHVNDTYLCISQGVANCNTPGAVYTNFANRARLLNGYTLVTLPNVGYVSADKNGTSVSVAETAPSSRWVPTQDVKGTAFATTPNVTDNVVYVDESVNFLVSKYNTAANGGINAYCITNEAGIWQAQTPRMYPTPITVAAATSRNTSLANAVKGVDTSATIFGGNFYGFSEYYNLQGASDWPAIKAANPTYKWYVDHYLKYFKDAGTAAGRRLMDVLSFHWYPEATGTNRIINANAYTAHDITARLQAPRSLWDATYSTYTPTAPYANGENSWILQNYGSGSWTGTNFFPLIPTIKNSVTSFYPNTKIAFGEYNYGGGNDITGGLVQADVLGIFGKYGIYYAAYWNTYNETNFISPAFRLYTNYNGNNGTYGNTNISVTNPAVAASSVYASIENSSEAVLHIIAINKKDSPITANFSISAGVTYNIAAVYQLDGSGPAIVQKADVPITGNTLHYTLPAYTAIHFVLTAGVVLAANEVVLSGRLQQQKDVALSWVQQQPFVNTVVQKSIDGQRFTTLATLSTATHYMDMNAFAQSSRVQYRLQCKDVAGQPTYSNTIAVTKKHNTLLMAYPNPATDKVTVQLPVARGLLTILDMQGRVLLQQPVSLQQQPIAIQQLSRGCYQLRLATGGIVYQGGFIKQ